jgi:hypothetical protein
LVITAEMAGLPLTRTKVKVNKRSAIGKKQRYRPTLLAPVFEATSSWSPVLAKVQFTIFVVTCERP